MLSGSEDELVDALASMIDRGVGEVLTAPLIDTEDRDGSIARAFAAAARADPEVRQLVPYDP